MGKQSCARRDGERCAAFVDRVRNLEPRRDDAFADDARTLCSSSPGGSSYAAAVAPQGPPTVFQQPGGGVAVATMSTDQGEQPARPSADPYGRGPYGQQEPQRAGAYYPQYPSSGKAQGG